MTRTPLPSADDRSLADAVAGAGDERAFRELYRRHTPALYQLVLRMLGGVASDAEDVVQETWIRAVRQLSKFRWESSLRTWVTAIGLNLAREVLRKRARSRTEELALRRAYRDPELSADLLMGESLDIVQHEHRAVPVREPRDRALEVDALGVADRLGAQAMVLVDFLGAGARALAQRLPREIEPDRREPGPKTRFPAELRKLSHRANPGLLHDVLCIGGHAAEHAQHELVQRRGVAPVQLSEGPLVARARHRIGQAPVVHG